MWRRQAPVLMLAGLTAALFHRILFGGEALIERDIRLLAYPQLESLARCAAAGSWPLWDPYVDFGEPMLANAGRQVLYPWTWIGLFVKPSLAYTFFVVCQVLLAGWGTLLLGRQLGLSSAASCCAAALFMTSGPVLSLVNLPPHLAGTAWLPWVLWTMGQALRRPGASTAVAWGLSQALQVLGGSPDLVVFAAGLQAGWLALHLGRSHDASVLRWVALAALVASGLTAAQWLPSLELLTSGSRDWVYDNLAAWYVSPENLVTTLLPVPLRDVPLRKDLALAWALRREPLLSALYLGAVAAPLVACGLASRRLVARLLGAMGLVSCVLALGDFTPVHGWLGVLVPPLRYLRYPAKYMILVALAWALLAGLGLDRARERRVGRSRWLALGSLLLAAGLGLAFRDLHQSGSWARTILDPSLTDPVEILVRLSWPVGVACLLTLAASGLHLLLPRFARLGVPALGACLVADTALAHLHLDPTLPRDLLDRPPGILKLLAGPSVPRVYSFDYSVALVGQGLRRPPNTEIIRLKPGQALAPAAAAALGDLQRLRPHILPLWGAQGAMSDDPVGVRPGLTYKLGLFAGALDGTPAFTTLLRAVGITHVISLHTEGTENLHALGSEDGVFVRPIRVFGVPAPLPRVFLARRASVHPGHAAFLRLVAPDFDPVEELVFQEDPHRPPAPEATATSLRLADARCDQMTVDVRSDAPAFLAVLDALDPFWAATLDGAPAEILRANVAFRAVQVPAGEHRVRLAYRPRTAAPGLALSGAALAVLLAAGARSITRQRAPE